MGKRKKRRVPEVLRRAYGLRIHTLEETILSLLPSPPPSPAECSCTGRRCLGCAGSPYLLRLGDSPDYRSVLARVFCVVSCDAPPPPVEAYLCGNSAQRLIVRNTMEELMMMDNSPMPKNVLCNGYDKLSHFSRSGEFLCTSAWDLLLARIGDPLMVFLLRFSSIFIPLPNKIHHQVTGYPLNAFLQSPNFRCRMPAPLPASRSQQSLCMGDHGHCGHGLKRRRYDFEDRPKKDATFSVLQPSSLLGLDNFISVSHNNIDGKPRRHVRQSNSKGAQTDVLDLNAQDYSISICSGKDNSIVVIQDKLNANLCHFSGEPTKLHACNVIKQIPVPKEPGSCCTLKDCPMGNGQTVMTQSHLSIYSKEIHPEQVVSSSSRDDESALVSFGISSPTSSSTCGFDRRSRKHARLFSWQRRRKHKKVNFPGDTVLSSYTSIKNDTKSSMEESSHDELHLQEHGSSRHSEKMASRCFYCLMLQTPQKVTMGDQIKRRYIFYTRYSSYSVFPRNHILNRLKPNDMGAVTLMKHIFGFPDGHLNTHFLLCPHHNGFCTIRTDCLYHSLLGLLKSFIRNSQRCQYRKLLHKHCSVPTFRQCSKDDSGSMSKVVKGKFLSLKMFKKKYTGSQCSSYDMLTENSYSSANANGRRKHLPGQSSKVCDPQFDPVESCCRHQQVVSFIWAVSRRIIPLDLLGNPSNWRALRKNISKFVRLRRYENFCLKQCIHGLKTSCYPFLSKIRCSDCFCNDKIDYELGNGKNVAKELRKSSNVKMILHNSFFHSWIYWFFSYMVVPMVAANFYVTETESGKQDVFYYTKPVWRKLVNRAITCLKEQNYRIMDNASLRNILSKRPFGFSKVRFLPKEKSVRPLANLRAPSKVRLPNHELSSRFGFSAMERKAGLHQKLMKTCRKRRLVHYRAVNSALRELHVILKRIKVEHSQKLGSSVFDYNDVYQKLYQFLSEVKIGLETTPKVFIVVSDVSKAFDSIDQDMLIGIMKDVIQDNGYLLRKYAKIVCTKKSVRALYDQVSFDKSNNNNITESSALTRFHPSNSILIDQGTYKGIKQQILHHLLNEHVKHNILQVGQNFYLQKVGISQGSLLSTLLCSFYYGHLERSVILPFLRKTHEQSHVGFKNTEVAANSCVHVSEDCWIDQADNACRGIEADKDEEACLRLPGAIDFSLSWKRCWFLNDDAVTDCHNGSKNENSCFPNSLLLRLIDDFLFISTSKKQATSFFDRMRRGFREYNCFMNNEKFGLNFDVDRSWHLLNRVYTGADGISFLPWSGLLLNCNTLEIQADYTSYMYKLIKKRMRDMELYFNIRPVLQLKKAEIVWLGLSAYIRVLKKKQSRHKELLSLLSLMITTHGRMDGASSYLAYAVDDSHSSLFWKIKY